MHLFCAVFAHFKVCILAVCLCLCFRFVSVLCVSSVLVIMFLSQHNFLPCSGPPIPPSTLPSTHSANSQHALQQAWQSSINNAQHVRCALPIAKRERRDKTRRRRRRGGGERCVCVMHTIYVALLWTSFLLSSSGALLSLSLSQTKPIF